MLIAGAGPTGLAAALELSRRGVPCRIIDRKDGPTPLSKAVGISPRSLEILEPSGVTPRLLEGGTRVRSVRILSEGRELGALDLFRLPHRFNFLLSLPQSDTEAAMAEALGQWGVQVDWQTALVGLAGQDDRIRAVLRGPDGEQESRPDVLFGADGVHSAVREAVGLAFPGRTHDRLWSIADLELAGWAFPEDSAQLFLHPNGDIGFVIPIGPGRHRVVANVEDALAPIACCRPVGDRLRSDTFHIPIRQAESYQRGAVFLGGDAAHVQSPVGARGMNLGIEDSAVFARRFAEHALDGYTAERRPVGRRWIGLSERVLAAAQAENPLFRVVRTLAVGVVSRFPALQQPLLERFAGLRE